VARAELTGLSPNRAVAGGRVRLALTGLDVEAVALPQVRLGDDTVRAAFAAPTSVAFVVPAARESLPRRSALRRPMTE
jgi:hypothetical protein